MVLQKDTFHYGLRVKTPTLDAALDHVSDPMGIRIPDRKYKRAALGLYRASLFEDHVNGRLWENQQSAASHELTRMEHQLSGETTPFGVTFVKPSPSADDVSFDNMAKHAQVHQETLQEQAFRHKVDMEAQQQMGEVRRANLSDYHFQGRRNSVLYGEVPLELRSMYVQEAGPAYGQVISTLVPRAAPPALPRAAGYGSVRELPTNREVNGEPRLTGFRVGGKPLLKEGDSYDSHRRAANI